MAQTSKGDSIVQPMLTYLTHEKVHMQRRSVSFEIQKILVTILKFLDM